LAPVIFSQIYEDTLEREMRPSVQLWWVEISKKGDPDHPVIEAIVNPTNYEVTMFGSYGKGTLLERLQKKLQR